LKFEFEKNKCGKSSFVLEKIIKRKKLSGYYFILFYSGDLDFDLDFETVLLRLAFDEVNFFSTSLSGFFTI